MPFSASINGEENHGEDLALVFSDLKKWGVAVLGDIRILTATIGFVCRDRAPGVLADDRTFKTALEKELKNTIGLPSNPQLLNTLYKIGHLFYTHHQDEILTSELASLMNLYFHAESDTHQPFIELNLAWMRNCKAANTIYKALTHPYSISIYASIRAHLYAILQNSEPELLEEKLLQTVYSQPIEYASTNLPSNSSASTDTSMSDLPEIALTLPETTDSESDSSNTEVVTTPSSPSVVQIINTQNEMDEVPVELTVEPREIKPTELVEKVQLSIEESVEQELNEEPEEEQPFFMASDAMPVIPLRRKGSSLLDDLIREGFNPDSGEQKNDITNTTSTGVIQTLLMIPEDAPEEEKVSVHKPLPLGMLEQAVKDAITIATTYINKYPDQSFWHNKHHAAVELRRAATFLLLNTEITDVDQLRSDFYAACKRITTFWTGELKNAFWQSEALRNLINSPSYKHYLANPEPVSGNAVAFGKWKNAVLGARTEVQALSSLQLKR